MQLSLHIKQLNCSLSIEVSAVKCKAKEIYKLIKQLQAGLESREYCRRDPSCWPRGTPYQQNLALTSSTSDSRSVGTVRSRTQTTEYLKQLQASFLG
jgi:hypothetical protein